MSRDRAEHLAGHGDRPPRSVRYSPRSGETVSPSRSLTMATTWPSGRTTHSYSGAIVRSVLLWKSLVRAAADHVVQIAPPMPPFTHHGEETPVAQELRIDVVLDLVGQAAGLATFRADDVELPVLPRHRLVGDQRAVGIERRSAERPGRADQRPRLGADGAAHQEPLAALAPDEGERAPVGAHHRRVTAVDRGRAAGGEHRDPPRSRTPDGRRPRAGEGR